MKVRLKFSKYGALRFIGHLDVMRYFQKAIRRAGIDIAYSEGFSPHQIMSFAAPLSVGHTSSGEYFDIEVTEKSNAKACASGCFRYYRNLPESLRERPGENPGPSFYDIDGIAEAIAGRLESVLGRNGAPAAERETEKKKEEILGDLDLI